MPGGKQWPLEVRGRIRIDYEAGASRQELEARYGVPLTTLSSWINKHGWRRPEETRAIQGAPLEALLGQALERELRVAGAGLTGEEAGAAMLRAQRLNLLSLAVGRWRAMSADAGGGYDPRTDEELRIALAERLERVSLSYRDRRLSGEDEPGGEAGDSGGAGGGAGFVSVAAPE